MRIPPVFSDRLLSLTSMYGRCIVVELFLLPFPAFFSARFWVPQDRYPSRAARCGQLPLPLWPHFTECVVGHTLLSLLISIKLKHLFIMICIVQKKK
jgi:hypothetical protein